MAEFSIVALNIKRKSNMAAANALHFGYVVFGIFSSIFPLRFPFFYYYDDCFFCSLSYLFVFQTDFIENCLSFMCFIEISMCVSNIFCDGYFNKRFLYANFCTLNMNWLWFIWIWYSAEKWLGGFVFFFVRKI